MSLVPPSDRPHDAPVFDGRVFGERVFLGPRVPHALRPWPCRAQAPGTPHHPQGRRGRRRHRMGTHGARTPRRLPGETGGRQVVGGCRGLSISCWLCLIVEKNSWVKSRDWCIPCVSSWCLVPQVLVGGRVVQHVRSPHRTKALVTGLPLAGSFTVALVAMATDGRGSTPAVVSQDRSRLYRGPKRSAEGEGGKGDLGSSSSGLRRSHSSPSANYPNHHRPLWNRSCVPSCL